MSRACCTVDRLWLLSSLPAVLQTLPRSTSRSPLPHPSTTFFLQHRFTHTGPVACCPADIAEENKPRNILEEIVWYKAVEIARWR